MLDWVSFSWTQNVGDILQVVGSLAVLVFTLGLNAKTYSAYQRSVLEPLSDADRKLIRNERAKLTATWCNTMGAASVVMGFITPAVGMITSFERERATYRLVNDDGLRRFDSGRSRLTSSWQAVPARSQIMTAFIIMAAPVLIVASLVWTVALYTTPRVSLKTPEDSAKKIAIGQRADLVNPRT